MRAWRWLLMPLATVAQSGCGGDGSGYTSVYDHARFYPDDWVYYDDDDEVFLAGLTDEQKDELKRRWDGLSPELDFARSRGPASDEQKALEEAGGNSRALQAGP